MTDPYLEALADVAGELATLQRRGPDFPAFHRGPILEQLGLLAGAIEDLRRRRQARAQDPGPVLAHAQRIYSRRGAPVLGYDVHERQQLAPGVPLPAWFLPAFEQDLRLAEDRAEWDAAPRW